MAELVFDVSFSDAEGQPGFLRIIDESLGRQDFADDCDLQVF
jgi:hypothetical protein